LLIVGGRRWAATELPAMGLEAVGDGTGRKLRELGQVIKDGAYRYPPLPGLRPWSRLL